MYACMVVVTQQRHTNLNLVKVGDSVRFIRHRKLVLLVKAYIIQYSVYISRTPRTPLYSMYRYILVLCVHFLTLCVKIPHSGKFSRFRAPRNFSQFKCELLNSLKFGHVRRSIFRRWLSTVTSRQRKTSFQDLLELCQVQLVPRA